MFHIHTAQAIMQDNSQFVLEGWVISVAVWNQICLDVAMTILVLQAFTVQCGATRSAAQQEAACIHITCCPSQVANALETEH